MVANLSQLKKAIKPGVKIQVVEHFVRPECNGQIREVTKVQTNGFYFKAINVDPDNKWAKANGGLGSWVEYGKTENWAFCGVIQYKNVFRPSFSDEVVVEPIATYRILEEV